ncbi:rRNA-binding ribosome biosynthesis protein rpf2 [Serendipita sp. 399]|nr:rRNA-binding ribosome biosynthesis protein rpf2 [Serendipita sp. 399]
MGPSLDLVLRRHLQPDPVLLAECLKRPKLAKKDVESGLGDKKKMRNKEVDEMGDLRGRVHIAKQDLSKLQTRKVKALKKSWEEMELDEDENQDVRMNGVEGHPVIESAIKIDLPYRRGVTRILLEFPLGQDHILAS